MNALKDFIAKFPTMSEEETSAFLTEHFDELPEYIKTEYAAYALSQGLADANRKAEARLRFHEALLAVLEVAEENRP